MKRKKDQYIAAQIIALFAEYRESFQELTQQAQAYFEAANWKAIQTLVTRRIDLYSASVQTAASNIMAGLADDVYDYRLWQQAKQLYIGLILQRRDPELAETFYNSVYCVVFQHRHIADENIFIHSSLKEQTLQKKGTIFREYIIGNGSVTQALSVMMDDFAFNIPWENKRRDIRNLLRHIRGNLVTLEGKGSVAVEIVKSLFFRNKAVYVVGRIRQQGKRESVPFIIAILNNECGGVYIDAVLSEEDDVSIVFSFTRSYFLVDVDIPSEFISFLHTLIPAKSIPELYSAIGFYKQAKAEFYRNFISHLAQSDDQFVVAPGTKGMVMTVFCLPSFPVVFKVIKDRFSSSKNITKEVVKQKYQLVKRHDRVGRMADTQEFTNLSFPLARFSPELITELQAVAGSAVEIQDGTLRIKHLWIERYMTPLNLYIDEAVKRGDEQALTHAINEYGKAIKQLAAANIFAGDMLFKNFGVTRHRRVVFYDYDEIVYLTECNFRRIPEPLYPEQELANEPWYSVGPCDVFPEEFNILTACNRDVRRIFNQLHGDLLNVEFWQAMQKQVRQGAIIDVFPYRTHMRFDRA